MADETSQNEETAVAAAEDAAKALDAVEAEAATELPAADVPATASAAAPAAPEAAAADAGPRPNRRKVREGIVVSDAMSATVVVAVVERVRHPKYGKTVQRTKKLYVHDAEDSAKVGDRVRVQETRPLSKLKRWRLTEVVERAR
jgi:small subunit ribosomal protein S17